MATAPVSFEVWMDFKVLFRIDIRIVFPLSTANDVFAVLVRNTLCIFLSLTYFIACPDLAIKQSAFPLRTACSASFIELYSLIFQSR